MHYLRLRLDIGKEEGATLRERGQMDQKLVSSSLYDLTDYFKCYNRYNNKENKHDTGFVLGFSIDKHAD